MREHLNEGQELTERVWQVLAHGYRQIVAASRVMQALHDKEIAAIERFRRTVAPLPQVPVMSTDEQTLELYHPVYEHIREEGGSLLLKRLILEARYVKLCETYHGEADRLLSGHIVRAMAPHGGFILTDIHGVMLGTQYGVAQGLYLRSDLASGGMYLLASQNNEQCQVYVPLFFGGDDSHRMSHLFVVPSAV